jgi:hypothetical protein
MCYFQLLDRRIRLSWEKVVLIVESRFRIETVSGPRGESGIRGGNGKKVGKRGCTGIETKWT